jgi:hypothetical protein
MSPRRSKKELTVLGGLGVHIVATLGTLLWGAIAIDGAFVPLGIIYSPLLWVAVLGFVLLLRRREVGAWLSLAYFGLQGLKFEEAGALVWPPGTSVGINLVLVQNASYTLELGFSSIVLAIVSAAVIFQLSEEKVLADTPEAAPLLPPNNSFERTREK